MTDPASSAIEADQSSLLGDEPGTQDGAGNDAPFSVSELSQALKRSVEDRFGHVRVRGEVSGFKRAASGHMYFALKDEDAVLDGVCWRGQAARLGLQPEDGMEVIARGRLTTYPGRSKYQIVVERMELAGEGALLKLLEDRKRKLAEEGLFDPDEKQDLPFAPQVIGVVTSPTGAVIRDILHRLEDRFPCHVLLWPVLVQGDGAADQVAAAIRGFNALPMGGDIPRPEVLIVARGGGSLEDLWAFNEEQVVRAAFESDIPLISAVGHETDWTLIDLAADRRAPTPTGAAEMAVPVRAELAAQVADDGARLVRAAARLLTDADTRLSGLARGLPDPRRQLAERAQRLDDWGERFANSLSAGQSRRRDRLSQIALRLRPPTEMVRLQNQRVEHLSGSLARLGPRLLKDPRDRLSHVAQLLESYSYERVLERGYALVLDGIGTPVTSAKQAKAGDPLTVKLKDGEIAAIAQSGKTQTAAPKKPPKKPKAKAVGKDSSQGELW